MELWKEGSSRALMQHACLAMVMQHINVALSCLRAHGKKVIGLWIGHTPPIRNIMVVLLPLGFY